MTTIERPILFSAPMVKAILDGRKTQTRRVGKIQSPTYTELACEPAMHQTKGKIIQATYRAFPGRGTARWAICEFPYGYIGDRLWIRETAIYQLCDKKKEKVLHYCADGHEALDSQVWTPSIFMPRWASRLTLEITGVRVERLCDISERDALAEGITWPDKNGKPFRPPIDLYGVSRCRIAAERFHELWDSINGKRDGGKYAWAKNPWVWCISFKKL